MKPALSQVCTLNAPFERDVEDYAAGKCEYLEIWLTKLEEYLKSHAVDDVRRLLDDRQIQPVAASYQGGLLTSQGEARRQAWELLGRRLQLCQQLKIPTLVVACDIGAPVGQQDLERAQVSLRQLGQEAERHELRVALEFQARAALGNNLQTAAALVAQSGSPQLGICLDAFHYHTGPSSLEDLGYLTQQNLFHVQLCDLADTPRELASDGDRILPGDGDIPLAGIVNQLQACGYEGAVSIELMNPQIWQIAPLQFGEIAMTALRKTLGLAAMA